MGWSSCGVTGRVRGFELPFSEGVQARQDLGVVVVVQTDAADQELLVYLPDHGAGAGLVTHRHGNRHPRSETPSVGTSVNLEGREREREREREGERDRERERERERETKRERET